MSRILIIEDEEAIADLEKDYLELSDFEVEIEHAGDRGLEKALNEDFDLVILDLMLPGIDGFEVCIRVVSVSSTVSCRRAAASVLSSSCKSSNTLLAATG